MKIAHIVPPEWEGYFPTGDYRMTLAQWLPSRPKYVTRLRNLKRKGAYIILDNGAFESVWQTNYELSKAIEALSPDEVVLPDVLGSAKETLTASWNSLSHLPAERVMFVPHGETVEERERCLAAWVSRWRSSDWAKSHALVIGLTNPEHEKRSRSLLLPSAAEYGYPVHFLGIHSVDAFARALPLAYQFRVRGVDSSLAFALGTHGVLLTPTAPKVPLGDIKQYISLSTWQKRLTFLNIAILDDWIAKGRASSEISTWLIRRTASRWLKYWAEGFADLEDVMAACGMPIGKYVLRKLNRREVSVRPAVRSATESEDLKEGEELISLQRGKGKLK